jgi:hypothetical protein
MLRIPYYLDNRLTDVDEVVSPTHPLRYTEGARGGVVVKALCYKPECRGYETR